jgi:prephenate dehydratase
VFHNVGPSAGSLALLPQENSIFGVVTETYDLLRSSELGESKWIRGAVTLSVQHCLVARRGKTMRDIKRVLSHEQVRKFFGWSLAEVVCLTRVALHRAASQALGQCSRFLVTYLPAAKLVKVPSTAAAAETISTQADDGGDDADSAAICSKICLQLFDNLEMLQEGIQDSQRELARLFGERCPLKTVHLFF